MEKRKRIADVFKGMIRESEDEIIWSLSLNKDIIKEKFGFEVLYGGNNCICGHMFEKLRHNDHVFHIDKLSEWIISGQCPHAQSEGGSQERQDAKTTFLHCACALGKLRVVKFLAHEHNISLESTTRTILFAPIHFAIYNKNMELFSFLMSKRVNVNKCCRGQDRYSPLMLAVLEKSREMVNILLKHESIQKNFVNSVQKGALCCAVENEDDEMINILVRGGVLATPGTFQRALSLGIEFILERVLSTRGPEFFLPRQQHDAIYHSIVRGRTSMLRILLKRGFSLKYTDQHESPIEESPLFQAVIRGETEAVNLLIKHKVDVSVKIGGYTALDLARVLDYCEISQILVAEHERKKLPLNKREQQNEEDSLFQTLLTLTLPNELLLPAIGKVVSSGSDVNAYDSCGFTPLHSAIFKDNLELVRFLLRKGSDPNRQSKEPHYLTPLQSAVIKGSIALVKILLLENVKMEMTRPVLVLYGTDTYHTDWIVSPRHMPRHRSALCDAVCRSHVHIALLLLQCGFNLTEEDAAIVQWMIKHTKSNHVRSQLTDHVSVPRKLSILCRDNIRRKFRHSIKKIVDEQDLPQTLKNMLLLLDIIPMD